MPLPKFARPIINFTVSTAPSTLPGSAWGKGADGGYVLKTAARFTHPIVRTTHPASDDFSWPDVEPGGFQFGAAELREAIAGMRDWSELTSARSPEIHWEDDFDEGLTEEEWLAAYGKRVA